MKSGEIVAYAASFTGPVAGNALLAMVSVLAVEWNVSDGAVLLAIPAFMLPFAVIQIFSGAISTAYDRRLTLSLGLLVYIVGSVGAALSPSFLVFLVARVVQGVGYAFVAPVLVPIVSDIAGKGRQGLAMGYLGSTSLAGVTAGPLLGGVFAEYNWRLAFIAIAVLASAVLVAVLVVFRRGSESLSTKTTPKESLGRLVSTAVNRDVLLLSATGFVTFASFVGVISYLSVHLGSDAVGM
ncbi:MAG: MFS transporter, partial [Thermoplasmata archaeon]|nr:MFS transporter [Thermoplasmata archaeon]